MVLQSALTPSTLDAPRKTCELCGESRFRIIADRDRCGGRLLTDLCETCGLVSHHQIPPREELRRFYQRDYRLRYHGEWRPSAKRVYRAWKYGLHLARRLRPYFVLGAPVLEIGAGVGCTVGALAEAGLRASGIEPHQGFQHYAREVLGANVARTTLENFHAPERYEGIIMAHVLEHLHSPLEALQQVHAMLASRGMLYLECPNLAAPVAAPGKLFHFAHIFNFTPTTLEQLAARAGFQVAERFGREDDVAIQFLLRKTDRPDTDRPDVAQSFAPDAAAETLRRAFRYRFFAYYARPSYLQRRFQKLAGYLEEYLCARRWERRFTARSMPSRRFSDSAPELEMPIAAEVFMACEPSAPGVV